jgi:hypothetical protein
MRDLESRALTRHRLGLPLHALAYLPGVSTDTITAAGMTDATGTSSYVMTRSAS